MMRCRNGWMLFLGMLCLLLTSGALATPGVGRRADDVTLTLSTSPINVPQGGKVGVRATITNNSNHAINLNQLSVTFTDSDLLTADTSPFSPFSGLLDAGKSTQTAVLFIVSADSAIAKGAYNGTVTVLGGADGDAIDNLAQLDFQVIVTDPDTTPPTTTITSGPDDGGIVCGNTVQFGYTGSDNMTPTSALTYQYRVDGGDWTQTASTQAMLNIATEGAHTFEVAAIDETGNIDPHPAKRTFAVLLTPTTLSGISASPRDVKATITWVTSRPATSQVEYGLTTTYGVSTPLDTNRDGGHTVTLTGLTPKTTYHYRVKSNDGCRDTVSDDQTFTTTDILKPNFSVTALTFPTPVRALDMVTVTWTVLNSGPGDAPGTWVDSVYLSDTSTLTDKATLLGKFDRSAPLDAFSSYDQTRQIAMPLKPAGSYFLIVKADGDSAVDEGSEDDNTLAMPIEFLKVSNLVAAPDQIPLTLNPTQPVTGTLSMGNLSGGTLTGLTATVENAPSSIRVQVTPPSSLNSLGTGTATYIVTALDESFLTATPTIHFTSNEGEDARVTLNLTIIPRRPQLSVTPGSFMGGMTRGKQNTVEVQVTNMGSVDATGLKVSVPQADWLSLASSDTIGTLAAGKSVAISLQLTPTASTALGHFTGNIALNGTNTGLTIPFDIACTSDAKGGLHIVTQDEYSFFADDKPNLASAQVVLKDPQTGAVVVQGTTDEKGTLDLPALPEGSYNLEATADKHRKAMLSVTVLPGQQQTISPFLPRQFVTYTWNVVPTDIVDQYSLDLQATFETHVPAPVVTVSPLSLDLRTLAYDNNGQTVVNYVITNHGLIAANKVHIAFNDDPDYSIQPAISDLGNLPALSTIVVPVKITKKIGIRTSSSANSMPCDISGNIDNEWYCGRTITSSIYVYCIKNNCTYIPSGGNNKFDSLPGSQSTSLSNTPSSTLIKMCDCQLAIIGTAGGKDINSDNQGILAGQFVDLHVEVVSPEGGRLEGIHWDISGTTFKTYTADRDHGILTPITPKDVVSQEVQFYWSGLGSKKVTCYATVNGQPCQTSIFVDVNVPDFTPLPPTQGEVRPNMAHEPKENDLAATRVGLYGPHGPGMVFDRTIVETPNGEEQGMWAYVQTVETDSSEVVDNVTKYNSMNKKTVLDTNWPYGFYDHQGNKSGDFRKTGESGDTQDSPDFPLFDPAGLTMVVRKDTFHMYIMYQPPGPNSTFVPLYVLTWSWHAAATFMGDQWMRDPANSAKAGSWVQTITHPTWTENIANHVYQ